MTYTLEFVKTARLELVDITEYIALDSVANAENFVSLLLEKYTSTLSQFPESGRTHKNEIRKISFSGYTAFYKVDTEKKTVYILHIIDQTKPLENRNIEI